MTLYQAKSVETKQFNVSTSGYKESPTVALQDGQSITYTGSSAVYSGTVTYQNLEGTDLELPKIILLTNTAQTVVQPGRMECQQTPGHTKLEQKLPQMTIMNLQQALRSHLLLIKIDNAPNYR